MAVKPTLIIAFVSAMASPMPAKAPTQVCESIAVWRSQDDWSMRGPLFSVVLPSRSVTISLGEGMEIRGKPPWSVTLCDGHLTIRRL